MLLIFHMFLNLILVLFFALHLVLFLLVACPLPYYLSSLKYALPPIVHQHTLWFKKFSKSLKYAKSNTLLPSSYQSKKFSKSLKYAKSNTLLPLPPSIYPLPLVPSLYPSPSPLRLPPPFVYPSTILDPPS